MNDLKKLQQYVLKCQIATEANPSSADAWLKWGDALGELEEYEEAAQKFKKAAELGSKAN